MKAGLRQVGEAAGQPDGERADERGGIDLQVVDWAWKSAPISGRFRFEGF
jgi:hypothetical protein